MSKFNSSVSFLESISGFFSLVLMVSSSGQIVIPVHSGYTGAPKGLDVVVPARRLSSKKRGAFLERKYFAALAYLISAGSLSDDISLKYSV